MQQLIGFCTTADGVRIAYATVGSGPALSSVGLPSRTGMGGATRSRLLGGACHHLVVRYDRYGCGLSDRNRTDFSLDSEVRTIEAIVKELGLKSFVLWGLGGQGATAAIPYAVKHPDHVSRLILSNAQARWHFDPASWGDVSLDAYRALVLSNSRMASLAMAERALGSSFYTSSRQWFFRFRQEAMAPEMATQVFALWWDTDVRDLLPKVGVPTLVVHYRSDRSIPFEAGRELAAGIPSARFVPLEGDAHLFFFNDTRPQLRAVAEFLGDPVEEFDQPPPDSAKSLAATEALQGVFRKEGEFWTIACWDKTFRLRDVRGLAYIAYLLRHPGEEFHVLSLASKNGGTQDDSAETATEEKAADLTVGRMGDAGEMLDAQAKAAYKRRTAELRQQLEEARELNQLELIERLEDEIEALGRELSRAVGLGGRDRRAASASERARINVTRAIKVALERIAEHNPALAALLTSSIRTGTFCSYTPDSRLPTSWQL
jgi:pimeloyl-ACP methyl ester carboxylesterase